MASHCDSLLFTGEETVTVEQVVFAFASVSEVVYLVPVSIEDQQTGIIGGLASLQSLNPLSQLILNHLQTHKPRD